MWVRGMTIEPVHLTREDLRSKTWERFTEDLRARIDALRAENDSFSDHDTTTKRRGRLAELKEWLALAQQALPREDGPHGGPSSFRPHGGF